MIKRFLKSNWFPALMLAALAIALGVFEWLAVGEIRGGW